jgi:hypothetical protein
MMENGTMIRLKGSVPIFTQMEHIIKDNGGKICSMDMERRNGLMAQNSLVNTETERRMV